MLSRPPSSPAIAILKPCAFAADQVCRRHAAILEHHHRGRLRFPAELLLLRAEGEPRRALLDHDAGDAARAALAGAHHADIDVGDAAAGDEGLGAVEHVVVAVARRARLQACGVGAGVRLGQAIAREMLHGAELRQELVPLRLAAERVDHPGRHVVDRDVGGGRGAALRQLLEDDRGVEPRQRRAADVVLHVDAAEAERRRLAQRLDRKGRVLVPVPRMRHHLARARTAARWPGRRAALRRVRNPCASDNGVAAVRQTGATSASTRV